MSYRNIDYNIVKFKRIAGRDVPCQPWPQVFYVSHTCVTHDNLVELRPLTCVGLIKGVGKNFVSMIYWRFLKTLWYFGFFTTKQWEPFSWSHFTLDFITELESRIKQ